ncbi:MAG: hydantoinase B/oxoprolinase family protein [Planctomycetota bacterium]
MDPIRLEVFRHLFASVAEEMGAVLMRTAFSANIKERRDLSCAVLSADAETIAQAEHIPVHLGSVPLSARAVLDELELRPGDTVVLNDPYCGGTHLPDLTAVTPVFWKKRLELLVVNRAHHADIGGSAPGSMGLTRHVIEEGLRIPPLKVVSQGERVRDVWALLLANVRTPDERAGDLESQLAANAAGVQRLHEMLERYGQKELQAAGAALRDHAETKMRALIRELPRGRFEFEDVLDDDGLGHKDVPIRVRLTIKKDELVFDFTGSSPQVPGSLNANRAITLSAVFYVLRLLASDDLPANSGLLRPVHLILPARSIVNAEFPAPVAGGNVETSQRIVDVVLGALAKAIPERIPAASAGTMNNVAFGGSVSGRPFTYYETIAGGMGARPGLDGLSAVQTHMTNTLNTPIEAFETAFPVRVESYRIRRGSGGAGRHRGGDGIEKTLRFLEDVDLSLLSERRTHPPYGLAGGEPGAPGENVLRRGRQEEVLPGKCRIDVRAGDCLILETPGGGGHGTR